MLHAAAEVYFSDFPDPSLKKAFEFIMTEVAGYAARRNEIAHGTVRWSTSKDGDREYYLVSPFYNTSKMKWGRGTVYAYTATQLFDYGSRFRDVYAHLDGFYWRFTARVAARSQIRRKALSSADRKTGPSVAKSNWSNTSTAAASISLVTSTS